MLEVAYNKLMLFYQLFIVFVLYKTKQDRNIQFLKSRSHRIQLCASLRQISTTIKTFHYYGTGVLKL